MIYKYVAVNKNTGLKEEGTLYLGLHENPHQILLDKNRILLNISPDIILYFRSLFKKKMSLFDLSRYFGYLAELQSTGINVSRALKILIKTFPIKYKSFLDHLYDNISKGEKLSDAMASTGVVPPLAITLVKAGEDTGSTESVYRRLKDFYEKLSDARSKLIKSLIYPLVVLLLAIGAVVFFSFILMPKLSLITETLSKGNLPLSTKVIFFIATIFRKFWWLFPIVLLACTVLVLLFRSFKPIEFYRVFSKIPLIGRIFSYIYLSQIFAYLEIFQKNGVSLLDALDSIASSMKNPYISFLIKNSADQIRIGETFSKTLGEFFPYFVVESVSIGEEQGAFEKAFHDISEFYNKRLEEDLSSFGQYLEMGLIILVGLFIAAIGIGLFLPIYKGLTSIKLG